MDVIERIVTQLQAVRLREGVYRARCPAHQGKSATSFSIKQVEDRILVHCHRGCTLNEILSALGMKSAAELFLAVRQSFSPEYKRALRIQKGQRVFDEWCSSYLGTLCKQLRDIERSIGFLAHALALFHKNMIANDSGREEELWELLSQCYRLRSDMEFDFAIMNGNDRDAKVPIYRRVTGAK